MSKPGKSLKALCKRLGVRLTVKRGKKRVYKSIAVLKSQCRKKKKKKVKGRRRFGTGSADEIDIPNLVNVFSPDSDYKLISNSDLEQNTNYKFTILGTNFQQGLQGMAPSIKQGKYIGLMEDTGIIIQFDDGETQLIPIITILGVHELNNVEVNLTGPPNDYLQSPQMQMMFHVLQIMHDNPSYDFPEAQQQYMQNMGLGPGPPTLGPNDGPPGPGPGPGPAPGPDGEPPTYMMYSDDGPGYYFGKRKKKVVKKKKVSAALKRLCKKHKVRLTVKRGKKRVYKSEKVLKKQCKNAMKKKK